MRFLTVGEVIDLHRALIAQSGGSQGIRDLRLLDSALGQPKATFDGEDLHPTLTEKAAALCVSLVQNHPFVDGNKRVGHAAMATFLVLNGLEIVATVEEEEEIILQVAQGTLDRPFMADWLLTHTVPASD
jgi:death-on-curing protein